MLEMGETTIELIKSISSSYMRAKDANRDHNDGNELMHLLHAVHDISVLLTDRFDDRIDNACARSYAKSLESSAKRIGEIFEKGF